MDKKSLIFTLIIILATPGCAIFKIYDPFYGTVVDETTQKPISGAVVLVEYTTALLTPAGSTSYYVGASETVTDKDGSFRIPAKLLFAFRPLSIWESNPYVHIVKPGYGCFEDMHEIIKEPKLNSNTDGPPWWSLPSWKKLTIALPKILDSKSRNHDCRYLSTCGVNDKSCTMTQIPYPQMRKFEKARYLLQTDASDHEEQSSSYADYFVAIRENDYSYIKQLISKGRSVNVGDANNYTVLMYAIEWRRYAIVELLLSHGAFIDAQDLDGNTPLIISLKNHSPDIAKLLIDRGANINLQAPLIYAIVKIGENKVYEELAKLMLDKGAKLDRNGDHGRSCLYWARFFKSAMIVDLLLSHGAKD